jgi:hypothetical protein
LYAKTGRIRTPSPLAESEEELEIVDLLSDSDVIVEEEEKKKSLGNCLCGEKPSGAVVIARPEENPEPLREAHLVVCEEEGPDNNDVSVQVEKEAVATSSVSTDTVHSTDSDFVPGESEPESEGGSTSSSAELVNTDDEGTEEGSSEDCAAEGTKTIVEPISWGVFSAVQFFSCYTYASL